MISAVEGWVAWHRSRTNLIVISSWNKAGTIIGRYFNLGPVAQTLVTGVTEKNINWHHVLKLSILSYNTSINKNASKLFLRYNSQWLILFAKSVAIYIFKWLNFCARWPAKVAWTSSPILKSWTIHTATHNFKWLDIPVKLGTKHLKILMFKHSFIS